jgi:hypothetical protein
VSQRKINKQKRDMQSKRRWYLVPAKRQLNATKPAATISALNLIAV